MIETNHTLRLATLENHDTIEDTELDAVTGAFYSVEHGGGLVAVRVHGSRHWQEQWAKR